MEELMRKLLSEKEKDEYDSGDKLELFAPSIAATVYPPGFRMPHLSTTLVLSWDVWYFPPHWSNQPDSGSNKARNNQSAPGKLSLQTSRGHSEPPRLPASRPILWLTWGSSPTNLWRLTWAGSRTSLLGPETQMTAPSSWPWGLESSSEGDSGKKYKWRELAQWTNS